MPEGRVVRSLPRRDLVRLSGEARQAERWA